MSARRVRKHRASVRRANHRAASAHGARHWCGDAYVIPRTCLGSVWCRDTYAARGGRIARCGFILTSARHHEARR